MVMLLGMGVVLPKGSFCTNNLKICIRMMKEGEGGWKVEQESQEAEMGKSEREGEKDREEEMRESQKNKHQKIQIRFENFV